MIVQASKLSFYFQKHLNHTGLEPKMLLQAFFQQRATQSSLHSNNDPIKHYRHIQIVLRMINARELWRETKQQQQQQQKHTQFETLTLQKVEAMAEAAPQCVLNPFDGEIDLSTSTSCKIYKEGILPLIKKYDGKADKATFFQTKVIDASKSRFWAATCKLEFDREDIDILKQPGKLPWKS